MNPDSYLAKIASKFLDAFHEDPGHSDLDRQQPIVGYIEDATSE